MVHDQLLFFVTLAEELHFGAASRRLAVSTSTLSRRLTEFERELGVQLFVRSSRKVTLSAAGAVMLDPARRALAELKGFFTLAAEAAVGHVGICRAGYSPGNGAIMALLVRRLREEQPEVETIMEQRVSKALVDAVHAGDLDVAVCRTWHRPGLRSITVNQENRDILVMPTDHVLTHQDSVCLDDLEGQTLLGVNPVPDQPDVHQRVWSDLGVSVRVRNETVINEADLLDRVAAGYGMCLLSRSLLARNPRSDVVTRPYVGPGVSTEEDHLVWRADNCDPIVAHFVRITTEVVPDLYQLTRNA